jgi:signal transduction histidine kinase
VCGVYRFTEQPYKAWNTYALIVFLAVWIISILLFYRYRTFSILSVRALRSVLFIFSGCFVLFKLPRKEIAGRKLAGISMILWGVYILAFGFIHIEILDDFIYGALVGFQVLAAFGLVVMIVDRIRLKAAESEKRIVQLEQLLPICAHCRKIRGKNNKWDNIETYIEEHTKSQFSHGICPDCLEKYFPQYAKKPKQ